jgi:hypothetical protein
LYLRKGVNIDIFMEGGAQKRAKRAGPETAASSAWARPWNTRQPFGRTEAHKTARRPHSHRSVAIPAAA